MSNATSSDSKTVGIIAYITLIGLIIAFIMNSSNKTEFGSFHIRQMLGLSILSILLSIVITFVNLSILSWVVQILLLVLWVLGFVGAVQGEKKLIPILGAQFQEWFKGI